MMNFEKALVILLHSVKHMKEEYHVFLMERHMVVIPSVDLQH